MPATLVVPCFNEANRLDVEKFREFAARVPDVCFLFVNDGSTDGTGEWLEALFASDPAHFQVLHLPQNQGKAEAVRQGMLLAMSHGADQVGYWDADLATPLSEIPRFRAALAARPEVEAVLGSRVKLLGRHIERKVVRHYLGRIFATAASLTLRLPIYDTQCGAKLFRSTPYLRSALERPFGSRWAFDVELLARLTHSWGGPRAARQALCELPLEEWRDVAGSKLRPFDFFRAPWDLVRVFWTYGLRRGPNALPVKLGSPQPAFKVATLRKAGFTISELLVAIAIISLLMALLLPAVQSAREAARRMKCSSQLRQLGMAVHGHEDAQGTLPVSVSPFWDGPRPGPEATGRGWIVSVLPHLEQSSLADAVYANASGNFVAGEGLKSPGCRWVVQTPIAILQCPSDASVRNFSSNEYQWEGIDVALTSYKGVIGDNRMGGSQSIFEGTQPDCHSRGGCNGLFWRVTYQEPVRLADVVDGTSHTFMIGEDVPAHNNHSAALYSNGDYASCHAPLNYFPRPPRPRDWPNVMSFRSRHPGGAQFCYADGSVRFVSVSIEQATYRALSTRAGGETVVAP